MWIMECVSIVSYVILFNGGLTSHFKAEKGLRQGDPMSPYLFVLAMEYLNMCLQQLHKEHNFNHHPRCRKLDILHACFADDLLMFCRADLTSILLMMKSFEQLSLASGLSANMEKSQIYIAGISNDDKHDIINKTGFSLGQTVSLDSKTTIAVPEDRYGLYAIDILDPDMILGAECVYYFHDMITEMIKWGFQEGKTLFGFGYDFRQSNRLEETMDRFAAKLESVYTASGGKRLNLITHSMGGILAKCFMSLHSDVFEKYVKNWIAISAPFQGAPGYVTSTFLNGCSFVDGWEQNFFISKWSMHQLLIECPSIYELMACPEFHWQHAPHLEIWREKHGDDGNSSIMLEAYTPEESISIFKRALSSNKADYDGDSIPLPFNMDILRWANETREILCRAKVPPGVKFYNIYGTSLETPHSVCYGSEDFPVTDLEQLRYFQAKYICVDGDGTVPTESAKADRLNAEARVGVPAEHRGIVSDHHVFRILKTWLKAGELDPFYDPLNDFVILPTAFEIEKIKEKGFQVTPWKEEWEVISSNLDDHDETELEAKKPKSFISVSAVASKGSRISI